MAHAGCTGSSRHTAAALTLYTGDWSKRIIHRQGLENKEILEGKATEMGRSQVSQRKTRDLISQEKHPDPKTLGGKCCLKMEKERSGWPRGPGFLQDHGRQTPERCA